MSEDREILKGLDELLEGAGNRFGPMLLDELQDRLKNSQNYVFIYLFILFLNFFLFVF